jgi:glycosyltransferase involved in cell wall biosynthesis
MLTVSQIDHDPRINKVATSLADHGFELDIIAPSTDGLRTEADVAAGVRHIRIPHRSRLFYRYQGEFQDAALERPFDIVHANDLTTLTLGWTLARRRRVPLVYDSHELWAENVRSSGNTWQPMSKRRRAVAASWEDRLLRDVDLLVTVSPSIVREFEQRGAPEQPPVLLPNYPSVSLLSEPPSASIRDECGLDDSHFVTLYSGGVNPLRNIETVVEAHGQLPETHVFVVRGPGIELYSDHYRELARRHGVDDRVFLLPPVGMNDVVARSHGADCGIVMLRNICKNFYYAFPNKLFEYSLAGLPVAASDFPDMADYVYGERCGVTFNPASAESIASAIRSLSDDADGARAMGERGRASILHDRNWEAAVERLVTAYNELC